MGGRPANLGLYCVSNSNGVNSNNERDNYNQSNDDKVSNSNGVNSNSKSMCSQYLYLFVANSNVVNSNLCANTLAAIN